LTEGPPIERVVLKSVPMKMKVHLKDCVEAEWTVLFTDYPELCRLGTAILTDQPLEHFKDVENDHDRLSQTI
jgi:hypothetical protein